MRENDPSVRTTDEPDGVECPYCGSTDTTLEHPKGPGLCRSMHFCQECGEPFERFA